MVMSSYLKYSENPEKGGVLLLGCISLVLCETSSEVKLWIKASKKVLGDEEEVLYLVLDRKAVAILWPQSLTSSWAAGSWNESSSPPGRFCFFPACMCHYPTLYCSHSSLAERLGDDIKVVEYVICIKASPSSFSPSPCPFSCLHSVPVGFCPPLQTSHPLAQLINDCFNNITAPPFSCVNDPSDMGLVTRSRRDFYFHPLKGHRK